MYGTKDVSSYQVTKRVSYVMSVLFLQKFGTNRETINLIKCNQLQEIPYMANANKCSYEFHVQNNQFFPDSGKKTDRERRR